MAINRHDPKIRAREQRWDEEVTARLPDLLAELLDSPVYGLTQGRPRPPENYGVYLFTEGGRPRYVGRVGLTERSRRAGKRFSNFRTRLGGHTRPRHGEGTYAYARTVRHFRWHGLPLAETRNGNAADPEFTAEFRRQCERVCRMGFQVVEITDNRLAAVFEIYAAVALGLRNQTFAVS
jgi:hypothetical protein